LKNTWAIRIAQMVWSRPRPASGPPGPSRLANADPTTTVGSTNGMVTSARTT